MLQIKTDLYRYVHYTSNVAVCNYQELIGCDVSFMVVLISERHGGLFCKGFEYPFLRRDLSRSVFAKQCAIRIDKQQKERYNNVVIDNDVII